MVATHHLEPAFRADPEVHMFKGLLFDMDGTIIDSTNAIIKHWTSIGQELGVDPNVILQTSHGRRSIDVLELYDKSKANWEYVCKMEGLIPSLYGDDAVEIPGSRALLDELKDKAISWAIVTSGTRPLVSGWLKVLKLAQPDILVTAEDVERGKPDPACYRLGAQKLGLIAAPLPEGGEAPQDNSQVLVLEDAPAGIKAGKAAGFKVIALATTHAIKQLVEAGADWVVQDMTSVTMRSYDASSRVVEIEIRNALI